MNTSQARFKINIKEGIIEIEGSDTFVERHLEKFEEICKSAIEEVVSRRLSGINKSDGKYMLEENPQPHEFTRMTTYSPTTYTCRLERESQQNRIKGILQPKETF